MAVESRINMKVHAAKSMFQANIHQCMYYLYFLFPTVLSRLVIDLMMKFKADRALLADRDRGEQEFRREWEFGLVGGFLGAETRLLDWWHGRRAQ